MEYIRNIASLHDFNDAIKTKEWKQSIEGHCKGINSAPIYTLQN